MDLDGIRYNQIIIDQDEIDLDLPEPDLCGLLNSHKLYFDLLSIYGEEMEDYMDALDLISTFGEG